MEKLIKKTLLSMEITLEDDGIYLAVCPEIDVWSQGETIAEAKAMLKEAMDLFFKTCQDMGTLANILKEDITNSIMEETNGTTTGD